jgi:segregation and condensation protein B
MADQTLPVQTVPDRTVPDRTPADQMLPDRTPADQTPPNPTLPDPTLPNPTPTDSATSREAAARPVTPEPDEPDEPGEPDESNEPDEPDDADDGDDESPAGTLAVAELELRPALEAVLMVVDEPATEEHLAKLLERSRREVADALRELADEYARQRRGFDLRLVAGGWRFYTRPEYAAAVERFVLDGQQARLTQAALETLAVVAYRQPVSRSRVSAVRGVNCDGVMRTLLQRGLVEEFGTEPETGAILYRTTNYFLERMGLRGLDELPELAPFLPEADAVEADSLEGIPSFDPDSTTET